MACNTAHQLMKNVKVHKAGDSCQTEVQAEVCMHVYLCEPNRARDQPLAAFTQAIFSNCVFPSSGRISWMHFP